MNDFSAMPAVPGWLNLQGTTAFFLILSGIVAVLLGLRILLVRVLGQDRWRTGTRIFEESILTLLILSLVGFSFAQIVLRNLFHSGRVWIDPLLRNLVLWIGLLGAFATTSRGRHLAVDAFLLLLPGRPRERLRRVLSAFAAVVCALLAHGAYQYLGQEAVGGRAVLFGLQSWEVQSILFFGFVLLTYRFVVNAIFGIPAGETFEGPVGPDSSDDPRVTPVEHGTVPADTNRPDPAHGEARP